MRLNFDFSQKPKFWLISPNLAKILVLAIAVEIQNRPQKQGKSKLHATIFFLVKIHTIKLLCTKFQQNIFGAAIPAVFCMGTPSDFGWLPLLTKAKSSQPFLKF